MLDLVRPVIRQALRAAALCALVSLAFAPAARGSDHSVLELEFHAHANDANTTLALAGRQFGSSLARSTALAQAAARSHARLLGVEWPATTTAPSHATPSAAVGALLERYGVAPDAVQAGAVRSLDRLGEPLRSSLTRVVDAFLVFDSAARGAHANTDPERLAALEELLASDPAPDTWPQTSATPTWRALTAAGVDTGSILAAREGLLHAVVDLQRAAGASGLLPPMAPSSLSVCPAIALDLGGTASTYRADCALVVDVGGNDVYLNNAGGAPVPLASAPLIFQNLALSPVAALVDLRGDDRYGDPLNPSMKSGVNGGASGGLLLQTAGFLVDAAGNDRYVAGSYGVNGGASGGAYGHLLDAAGNDSYTGGRAGGVNGGGNLFGVGLLVDGAGTDYYRGERNGANGGASVGIGTLVSVGGGDTYAGVAGGVNGGGLAGVGLLLDSGGNDAYSAASGGVNGAGNTGVGLLVDQGGTDSYSDQERDGLTQQACPGTGTDRTVAPKCLVGAQIDRT